jgi:hypothetical protein
MLHIGLAFANLYNMINAFHDFWVNLSAEEKRALCESSGLSPSFLSQIAHGHRNAGRKTIGNLVTADPRITFEMFFEAA